MKTNQLPKYILNLKGRFNFASVDNKYNVGDMTGYVYKLKARRLLGAEREFINECNKLVSYAERNGASAKLLEIHWGYDYNISKTSNYRKKNCNYAYIYISDFIAYKLEKALIQK